MSPSLKPLIGGPAFFSREVQPGETLHLGGSVEMETRLKGPVLTSGIFVFTEKVSKRSLNN